MMVCANCGKEVYEVSSEEYNYVRLKHVHGGYFCHSRGGEHATLPVIPEAYEPLDEVGAP